jgi:uncharacterized membrane protein
MRTLASAAIALALAACGEDYPAECRDSPLTYETFGAPFMISWCRGCHSRELRVDMRQRAPVDVNLDTLGDVRAHATRIVVRAGAGSSMPPAGGPSADERALLAEWIGCGAP